MKTYITDLQSEVFSDLVSVEERKIVAEKANSSLSTVNNVIGQTSAITPRKEIIVELLQEFSDRKLRQLKQKMDSINAKSKGAK